MTYAKTEERCHVEHMGAADLQDHMERYYFAANYVRGKRVLDIACGTGYGSAHMRQAGAAAVLGVDVSDAAIQEATRLYGSDYRVGSILDFDNEAPFDTVISFETIEHVEDYRRALANLRRLLKPGGTLLLSTPNRPVNSPHLRSIEDRPRSPFHVREFSTQEIIEAVVSAGFATPEVYGQKLRRIFKRRPLRTVYAAVAYAGLIPGHFAATVLPLRPGLEPRYCILVSRDVSAKS